MSICSVHSQLGDKTLAGILKVILERNDRDHTGLVQGLQPALSDRNALNIIHSTQSFKGL